MGTIQHGGAGKQSEVQTPDFTGHSHNQISVDFDYKNKPEKTAFMGYFRINYHSTNIIKPRRKRTMGSTQSFIQARQTIPPCKSDSPVEPLRSTAD